MKVRAGLGVHDDRVSAGSREGFEVGVGRRDHQVHVEGLVRVRAHRRDDRRPEGDVGHEMPIHHVEVEHVGAGRRHRAHFGAEHREVGGQDGRQDLQGSHRRASWRARPRPSMGPARPSNRRFAPRARQPSRNRRLPGEPRDA